MIILTSIIILLAMMFAEYRFIMLNIHPYKGENGTVSSIGVGNLLEDVDSYSMTYWPEDKSYPPIRAQR